VTSLPFSFNVRLPDRAAVLFALLKKQAETQKKLRKEVKDKCGADKEKPSEVGEDGGVSDENNTQIRMHIERDIAALEAAFDEAEIQKLTTMVELFSLVPHEITATTHHFATASHVDDDGNPRKKSSPSVSSSPSSPLPGNHLARKKSIRGGKKQIPSIRPNNTNKPTSKSMNKSANRSPKRQHAGGATPPANGPSDTLAGLSFLATAATGAIDVLSAAAPALQSKPAAENRSGSPRTRRKKKPPLLNRSASTSAP
jgi:hypothetical protein